MYTASPTYLRNENLVTLVNTHWYPATLLGHQTRANCQHLGLIELLHCSLREEETTGSLRLGLHALNEDSVEERGKRLDGLESGRLLKL